MRKVQKLKLLYLILPPYYEILALHEETRDCALFLGASHTLRQAIIMPKSMIIIKRHVVHLYDHVIE